MRSMRILNDEVVKRILDIKTTIECVEKAYSLKAKKQVKWIDIKSRRVEYR